MDFVKVVYSDVLPSLPEDEKWALSSQLRRSSQSIPSNIAEGYGRYYYQETIRFCYIARGSLEEAFTKMKLANDLGYLPDEKWEKMNDLVKEMHRMLNGYVAFLKRSKRGENEPGSRSTLRESMPIYDDFPDEPNPDP